MVLTAAIAATLVPDECTHLSTVSIKSGFRQNFAVCVMAAVSLDGTFVNRYANKKSLYRSKFVSKCAATPDAQSNEPTMRR